MLPALRVWLSPLLLGALTVVGFAPFELWFVPLLTLAALFALNRAATPRAAFVSGWMFGLGLFGAGVSWVFVSLSLYGGLSAPLAFVATALFCAFIALFPALALYGAVRLAPAGGARLLLLPAAWVAMEWVRGWVFTGFPWLTLSYAHTPGPLAGFAPLLGVYGVSLMAALLSAALVSRRPNWMTAAILLLPAGHFLLQVSWTQLIGAPVSVALLQGNVPQAMKFQPERLSQTLNDYRRDVLASRARLIVLPETALPLFRAEVPPDYLDSLAQHARAQGGDVLLGLPESEAGGAYYNSLISLGASPEGRYRKHHLVPFGEFVPPGFRWLVDQMQIPLGDFARGAPDQPPIAAGGQQLAVNVCYEDAFGEERITAARHATLLVNVSNDAWFGNSLSPRQHLQIGAMRSLETGRWQLRANNTGITAILDASGRARAELPPFTQATLTGTAQGMTGITPYMRWGNAAVLLIIASLASTAIFISRKVSV